MMRKRVFIVAFILSMAFSKLFADSGFCSNGIVEDVTSSIVNNDFNSAGNEGSGWATGWTLKGGLNKSSTYKANGQYVFLWDSSTLSQTINIDKDTDYQIKFLGAYSVKKDGKSDPYDDEYKGQAVRFTFSNGTYIRKEVKHWIYEGGDYNETLYPYTVNLGNSGNNTQLTIKACAGGCTGAYNSFIKIDYFRLYKCVPDNGGNNPPPPPKISITKKIKLTIYNDDINFLAKDGTSEKLHTKVVNNQFALEIHSVDENKNDQKNTVASDVKVRLIPASANCLSAASTGITSWISLDMVNKEKVTALFKSAVASKSTKVQIKWKNVRSQDMIECCSADNFAIRPDKFNIVLPSSDIKAGEEFEFKIIAKDKLGNPTNNYNETKDISFRITRQEKKSGCTTGNLKVAKKSFLNGNFIDTKATYDNVGEIDITVEEIPGSEFAVVDRYDTPDSVRYITKDTVSKKFIPAKLSTVVNLTDAKPNITFYAANPSTMAANLNLKISATTSSGIVLSNYTSSCYAKDTDVKITYSNSNTTDIQTIKSDKTIIESGSDYFKIKIPKTSFTTPTATEDIKINLDRDPKVVKNPNKYTITRLDVSDGSVTTVVTPTSNNIAHFYYGRAHVPSPQSSDTDEMKPKVYYEVYCKGCNKTTFAQASGESSVDSVYWYILPPTTVSAFGSTVCDYKSGSTDLYAIDTSLISSLNHQDNETIKIKASKVPSKNKIFYEPVSSFLQYNKFGTALPKHYFDISFTSSNTQWAGEGTRGTVVDTTISKKAVKSLEW